MYQVLSNVNKKKVFLFEQKQKIAEFENIVDFLISYWKRDIYERLGSSDVSKLERNPWGGESWRVWNLRDISGDIILREKVLAFYDSFEYKLYMYRRYQKRNHKGRKYFHRSIYRRPRTTQELRANLATQEDELGEEVKVKTRGRRRKKLLPNAWDDIPSGKLSRNWKRYRDHQWKNLEQE